jgi:alkaline phosphatase
LHNVNRLVRTAYRRILLLLCCVLALVSSACGTPVAQTLDVSGEPTESVFPWEAGGASIAVGTTLASGEATVKNVILMISDGCGYNHVLATDHYLGRTQVYEGFPVRLAVSTHPHQDGQSLPAKTSTAVDRSPGSAAENSSESQGYDPSATWEDFDYSAHPVASPDSASAATAMASAVKTYPGAIGVGPNGVGVELVTERAELLGKATGVVTSVQWSHATPAVFVAHNPDRYDYAAIAQMMILESATDVIMGAGSPDFDDDGVPRANDASYVGGADLWAQLKDADPSTPLVADADGDGVADPWTVLETGPQIDALATASTTPSRVLGTVQVHHTLQQARSGASTAPPYSVPDNPNLPTLATMVRGALNVLDNDPQGFFLMVEGGAVDWASHANQTGRMIEEQIDFNRAVDAVVQWVESHSDWAETLLIVTADHETGMLWGPGSGTVRGSAHFAPLVDNGPGQVPDVSWGATHHTSQLVPLYAKGSASHLLTEYVRSADPVRGPYIDNTDIALLMFAVMK